MSVFFYSTIVCKLLHFLELESTSNIQDQSYQDNKKGKSRTSITPKQLEILQSTYDKDPRPSRLVRDELAAQTSLSTKVIQVWFQNRRSKEKKDGIKVEGVAPQQSFTGIPLLCIMSTYYECIFSCSM